MGGESRALVGWFLGCTSPRLWIKNRHGFNPVKTRRLHLHKSLIAKHQLKHVCLKVNLKKDEPDPERLTRVKTKFSAKLHLTFINTREVVSKKIIHLNSKTLHFPTKEFCVSCVPVKVRQKQVCEHRTDFPPWRSENNISRVSFMNGSFWNLQKT